MNDLHDKFAELCRANGWKCTSQRFAVYSYLHGQRNHPSVDQVLAAIRETQPAVTRESVYRILNEFAAAGFIRRIDRFSGARYDTETGSHLHFICERCGEITDYPLGEAIPLPPELKTRVLHHTEIRITGLCPKCMTEPPKSGTDGK